MSGHQWSVGVLVMVVLLYLLSLRNGQTRPTHRQRGPLSESIAIEDARLTPLGAVRDDIDLVAIQRMKRMGDANYFVRAACS